MYFNSIVLLRAIAALSVCFFHFTCGNPFYLSDTNWVKKVGFWGSYGVDIFFVVSGFVIPYSLEKKSYRLRLFLGFMQKRFIRIELPYLASIVLALLVGFLVSLYKQTFFALNLVQIFAHLFYFYSILGIDWLVPVYWTLAIEFQYYIWIGLFFPYLFSRTASWQRYASWSIWIILSFLVPKDIFVFHYVGLFGVGIVLCLYYVAIISKLELGISVFIALMLVALHIGFFSVVAGCLAGSFIFYECTKGKSIKISRIFLFLGTISYSLYLTHVLIAGKFIGFTEQFTRNVYIRVSIIPLAILIAVGVAYLFYRTIEKNTRS